MLRAKSISLTCFSSLLLGHGNPIIATLLFHLQRDIIQTVFSPLFSLDGHLSFARSSSQKLMLKKESWKKHPAQLILC